MGAGYDREALFLKREEVIKSTEAYQSCYPLAYACLRMLQAKRLEAIKIKLQKMKVSGNIEYQSHVQTYGWEKSWKKNGQLSGTSGKAKRLEAVKIRLTGEMKNKYDVYYRVHAQSYGWLGWAKNGEKAGTEGLAKRLEAVQIVLVEKGGAAPGSTEKTFIKK